MPENEQSGERHLGLEDEQAKKKTPTIGRFLALSGGDVTFKLKCGRSSGLKCNAKVKQL